MPGSTAKSRNFAGLRLDRYKIHYVELVVDRLVVKPDVPAVC